MAADPKLTAAASVMGMAIAGLTMTGGPAMEIGADFTIDEAEQRVWARVTVPSGDVYEISTRWVGEDSP